MSDVGRGNESLEFFTLDRDSVTLAVTINSWNKPPVGFRTGIPRVRFSHTVPTPAETVPMAGVGTYRPVKITVCHKTRGISLTRGYSHLKYSY